MNLNGTKETILSKTCSSCKIPKSEEDFYKYKNGKLREKCKSCYCSIYNQSKEYISNYDNNHRKIRKLKEQERRNLNPNIYKDYYTNSGKRTNFISKGEVEIENFLISKGLIFEKEKTFDNNYWFDFWIENLNIIIEYDGEFHFQPIFGENLLNKVKLNDTIKNNFCKQNNIQLIRIPYWEFKNIKETLEKWLKF
jgi:very-short-patch-repair endonuclease